MLVIDTRTYGLRSNQFILLFNFFFFSDTIRIIVECIDFIINRFFLQEQQLMFGTFFQKN